MMAASQLQSRSRGEPRKEPSRTCVGCRAGGAPRELVRFVRGPDGSVVVDLRQRTAGRGAWVHPRADCLHEAAARGLARSYRARVEVTAAQLHEALAHAADRRSTALIASAQKARKLACGTDAVRAALAAGRARLVIVARDARAAASKPWIERAVASGDAVGWGDKKTIGEATGRPDTAVVGVLDTHLADALKASIRMSQIPQNQAG